MGEQPQPLACVIVNPSKPAVTAQVRDALEAQLRAAGYRGPIWLETSRRETGATQARLALACGARLVVAAGGDGTVRAVAAGLAGSQAHLGILALGTANLAARNLGIPVGNVAEMIQIASRAPAHAVDMAWVLAEPAAQAGTWARPTLGREHACLVVTGIGFDAALVARTRPRLKARLKWGAYAVAAMENLRAPRMEMTVTMTPPNTAGSGQLRHRSDKTGGNAHEQPGEVLTEKLIARCLLISNAGTLPARIQLIPQALMDDGVLDIAAIDTVGGLAGWTSLARQVLPPFPAHYSDPDRSLGRVRLAQASEVSVVLPEVTLVEVDGELLPPTRSVRVRLQPQAVLIRRPTPAAS